MSIFVFNNHLSRGCTALDLILVSYGSPKLIAIIKVHLELPAAHIDHILVRNAHTIDKFECEEHVWRFDIITICTPEEY